MQAPALLTGLALLLGGCSLVTVKQDPFPPLQIQAARPPPKPPRVVLTPSQIEIKDKVQFATGSVELLPVSFGLLDAVVSVLADNPQLAKLEIQGHTDGVGSDSANRKLSQGRAESVRAYMTGKGIDGARLVAKGYGESKPIADNATDEGREQNRRVEFHILTQGPKSTLVEDE